MQKECWLLNCQNFGHLAKNCKAKIKCVICGVGHSHKGCPNREKKQPKCANCKGPHVANYKGCPAYQKQAFRQQVVDNQKGYVSNLKQNSAPLPQPKGYTFSFTADQLVKFVAIVAIQIAQPQVCYTNAPNDAVDKKSSLCRRVPEAAKSKRGISISGSTLFDAIGSVRTLVLPASKIPAMIPQPFCFSASTKPSAILNSISPPTFTNETVPKQSNCQNFGHSAKNCKAKIKCVICGVGHSHKGCPNREKKQPKCANCKGPHVANYKGCPAYQKQAFRQQVVDNQKGYVSNLKQNSAPLPQPKGYTFSFTADQLLKFVAIVAIQIAQPQVCYTNAPNDAVDKKSSLCRRVPEAAKSKRGISISGSTLFDAIGSVCTPALPASKIPVMIPQPFCFSASTKPSAILNSISPPTFTNETVPKQSNCSK